jgi:hypothetical protein
VCLTHYYICQDTWNVYDDVVSPLFFSSITHHPSSPSTVLSFYFRCRPWRPQPFFSSRLTLRSSHQAITSTRNIIVRSLAAGTFVVLCFRRRGKPFLTSSRCEWWLMAPCS